MAGIVCYPSFDLICWQSILCVGTPSVSGPPFWVISVLMPEGVSRVTTSKCIILVCGMGSSVDSCSLGFTRCCFAPYCFVWSYGLFCLSYYSYACVVKPTGLFVIIFVLVYFVKVPLFFFGRSLHYMHANKALGHEHRLHNCSVRKLPVQDNFN